MVKTAIKNDRYRRVRGGYSRMLEISCEKCGAIVCRYQKDGPGNLRRMYIDRIADANVPLRDKNLACAKGHILGVKTIYEKEGRPAYRMFVDAVRKKIVKS